MVLLVKSVFKNVEFRNPKNSKKLSVVKRVQKLLGLVKNCVKSWERFPEMWLKACKSQFWKCFFGFRAKELSVWDMWAPNGA